MSEQDRKPQQATLGQVLSGILASFFGVRRRQKHEEGMAKASPGQVVIIGLALTALFVLTLYVIVRVILHLATG